MDQVAYLEGFQAKAAEYGVDPQALMKSAQAVEEEEKKKESLLGSAARGAGYGALAGGGIGGTLGAGVGAGIAVPQLLSAMKSDSGNRTQEIKAALKMMLATAGAGGLLGGAKGVAAGIPIGAIARPASRIMV